MRLFLSYFSNTVFCSYSGCDLGLDRLCHHRDGISIPSSKEKCQSRRRCWIPSLWSHRSRQRHFTLFRWSETGAKRTTLPLPTYQATNDRFWHQWQRKGPKRWKYFRERRWGRRRRLHCLWVSWTCSGTKPSFFSNIVYSVSQQVLKMRNFDIYFGHIHCYVQWLSATFLMHSRNLHITLHSPL